ncbi:MAG: ATPase [Rhodospirillales bacterium]|nr:ATPase [Rhodospirillales bacterium]
MTAANDGKRFSETMVRFERVLPGPVDRVWRFLTETENLAWLGGGTIEPREGGAVDIAQGHIRGVVTQWRPPHVLAFTWNVMAPGEKHSAFPESYVTWELKDEGSNVRLTLTHRPILEGFESQTMMGWHTILDMLDAQLHGREASREKIMEENRVRYGVTHIKMTRD